MGGKNSYESIKRYQDKAYDKILVRLPKGKKDTIQAHAEALGQSVNGFINRAIDNQISQDRDKGPSEALQAPSGAGAVSLPSETIDTAQRAAEAAGEDIPQFVARAVDIQAKRDKSSLALGINPSTGGKLEKEA